MQDNRTIDAKRLLLDLHELRSFGATQTGVVRPALSDMDIAARLWLAERFAAAGLDVVIDRVGNVFGNAPVTGPCLLIGSHSDTQPEGGWLDGAMGVIFALEIARTLGPGAPIDIVSWSDEEARFVQYLGSRQFTADIDPRDIALAHDAEGKSLAEAMSRFAPHVTGDIRLDPSRHAAYFEAHIEQGGVLESLSRPVGIVSSIVGALEIDLEFSGVRNHAGTTPMRLRSDAAMALFRTTTGIDAAFRSAADEDTVWNVNAVSIAPASPSIVADQAKATVQIRDTDAERLDRLAALVPGIAAEAAAATGASLVRCTETFRMAPAPMDRRIMAFIEAASIERVGREGYQIMPSGAGHDAQILAARIPTGMLFVPSIGGISHSFDEDTREEDIVAGCQVAADAAARIVAWIRTGKSERVA